MIRTVGTCLILPKGDTGSFFLPIKSQLDAKDIAIFSVKDILTQTTVIEKKAIIQKTFLTINLKQEDTINLKAGKYYWDIKIYHSPEYDEDGKLVDAAEINSYYSAFKQPLLILKEVAKDYV